MRKITSYLLFFLVLFSLLVSMPFSPFGNNIVVAGSLSGNSSMGYELLDDGAVFHMWNGFDDYYFNTSSGIQVTNHYQQYWTHNVMLLGYYAGSTWNIIYRTDELTGFSWSIDTDDSTYINVTGYRDLSYAGYSFRLAIRYCLNDDSEDLTIIPYIKNLGIPIPFTLGFGWEIKDIKIGNTYENDQIRINSTSYLLNQGLDITYRNITKRIYNNLSTPPTSEIVPDPIFYLDNLGSKGNINKLLYLAWDSNLDYIVQVKSKDGQYNAPVTLFIKVGVLASGQEKYTKLHWWDSDSLFEYYIVDEDGAGGCYGATWDAQTFTVGAVGANQAHRITSVKLKLYRLGSPGTITIQIKAVDPATGKPTGANLTWATTNGNTLSAVSPGGYREINFTVKPSLSAGTQYAIIMNVPNGDALNYVLFMEDSTVSAYAGGAVVVSADAGTTWTVVSAYDMMFYEYGTEILFNITTYPATGIKATNATLNGMVSTGNQTAHMQFKYGTTKAYGTYTTNQSCAVNTTQNYNQNILGLTPGKLYRFRASGKNTTKTIVGTKEELILTKPEAPTNVLYNTINSTAINISWTKGTGANRTVMVKKTGSIPTNPTDGTVTYNNTGTYYRYTKATNEFIQLWSFSKWINGSTTLYQFSDNGSIYAVFVNCYRESNGTAITNYTVFFSNPSGTSIYTHYPCNNPFAISVNSIPIGNDISLIVNRTGYSTRTYIFDISNTGNYYINTYLTTNNTLYLLAVIDELTQPISDAKVTISKYINATAGFKNVSIIYTDGAGQLTVYLQPFKLYKFYITHASGTYQDEISDWTTSDQLFTHTFMIRYVETPVQPEYIEPVFEGGRGGTTIFANYTDAMAQTTDATIWLYKINSTTGNITLVDFMSYTSTNTINYVFLGSNTSCDYKLYLFFNHTSYGPQARTLVFKRARTALTTPNRINTLLDAIMGHAGPFLWQNVIMFLFFMVMMFSIDKKDAGKGTMLIGGIFIFVSMIGFTDVFSTAGRASIPALFIIVGLATEWINSRRNY